MKQVKGKRIDQIKGRKNGIRDVEVEKIEDRNLAQSVWLGINEEETAMKLLGGKGEWRRDCQDSQPD